MNTINIYSIAVTVLMVLLGFVASYIKTKSNLISKAGDFINQAEEDYKSVAKAGNEKFNWVVETLYGYVPVPMRFVITKQFVSNAVQAVFDKMAEYATKQLDKIVDKI